MNTNSLRPFISIVIPTRDRPDYVELCLSCLAKQTFTDFEVIVSDNFKNLSCKAALDIYVEDKRFHYFAPTRQLSMCDNWDFVLSKAQGEYVTLISEKYMFRPDALATLHRVLQSHPAELVSWWNETLMINEFSDQVFSGNYVPHFKPKVAEYFCPIEVLQQRFSFEIPPYSRSLGPSECYGKIYSGCYHRNLISRIIKQHGRVFSPISPDITSMIAALSLARTCLDLGQPLMLACTSANVSTGYQCMVNTASIKEYFASFSEQEIRPYLSKTPLENLWVGITNGVARDYCVIQSQSSEPRLKNIPINRINLLIRAKEDLDKVIIWANDEEKHELHQTWLNLLNECSESDKDYICQQLAEKQQVPPSQHEIFFAGGIKEATYMHKLSAKRRAEINWLENKVFRIKEEFLHYDNFDDAMAYFSEYFRVSEELLLIK
tara:strand:+ start:1859 stop:3163 length:1305 start_codon:yes stop_codon:yes gene_type:complete